MWLHPNTHSSSPASCSLCCDICLSTPSCWMTVTQGNGGDSLFPLLCHMDVVHITMLYPGESSQGLTHTEAMQQLLFPGPLEPHQWRNCHVTPRRGAPSDNLTAERCLMADASFLLSRGAVVVWCPGGHGERGMLGCGVYTDSVIGCCCL